ncbi:MAG: class I SAM-dependent methyltransferase [Anaerolineales bacterium]
MIWLFLFLLLAGALLFWELRISEGAHLGRRFVVWLYNLAAKRYDRIKKFDFAWENRILGEPITDVLMGLEDALLLDMGAGTGRLSRTLLPLLNFKGTVINLEPSKKMLNLGRDLTNSDRAPWLRGYAVPLPFDEGTFDLVASLEVLEFTPHPKETLQELVRVLLPGGWMIITNRVGWEAKWILGRTHPRDRFGSFLEEAGLENISVYPWQVDYDLAWARKPFANVR